MTTATTNQPDVKTLLVNELVSSREHLMEVAKLATRVYGETSMERHRATMAIVEVDSLINYVAFPDEADEPHGMVA